MDGGDKAIVWIMGLFLVPAFLGLCISECAKYKYRGSVDPKVVIELKDKVSALEARIQALEKSEK